MGSSPVCSTLGYYYFVTFIDDFFCCTWLFLMKNCYGIYNIFQGFYTEIQNQFGSSIKILDTNNAHEYKSSQFQLSMTSQHYSSNNLWTAYTPQQNQKKELALGLPVPFFTIMFLFSSEVMCFSWHVILSTACLPLFLTIRFPTLLYNQSIGIKNPLNPHIVL